MSSVKSVFDGKMKIKSFAGVYIVLETGITGGGLQIMFVCSRCHQIVEPDEIILGTAHIYAKHCNLYQDVGTVIFKKGLENPCP